MKAVLWDMDGTLVDTEPYWIATEVALAEEYGGTWSHEDAMHLVGNSLLGVGRLHPRADGHPAEPDGDRRRLLDGVVAQVAARGAVVPRGRSSCCSR